MGAPVKDIINMELWSINKWLRWTGFRIFVIVGKNKETGLPDPTRIGIGFWGWKDLLK
jgi:hypothetical protein